MKLILPLVALVGFTSVAGAIFVAERSQEPTVVADPYEEGLRYDEDHAAPSPARAATSTKPAIPCGPSAGPCAVTVDDMRVALAVSPWPPRSMADLTFTVDITRSAVALSDRAVEISLGMPGMYMGDNRVSLAPLGSGRYRGRGVIVRCPSGRRNWVAEVSVRPREPAARGTRRRAGAPVVAAFTFDVAD